MKTIYIRLVNVNWAKNTAVLVGSDDRTVVIDCGNFLCFCGPDNFYTQGVGAIACGGYNRHAGMISEHYRLIT